MLVIRDAQLSAFALEARRNFARNACAHLRRMFPGQLRAMADDALEREIETAAAAATEFGLVSERDCYRYLNLCLILGWRFIQQPGNEWMLQTLCDSAISHSSARLDRLIEKRVERWRVEARNLELAGRFGER